MIPLVKVGMPPREAMIPLLEEVLYSGMIAEGDFVYRFELEFAKCFNLPNALAISSGTGALHVALKLAGVELDDEVITTPMTAEPTNLAILHCGAKPIFADIHPRTGNLDAMSVESLITSRTRAIVVVHYAGFPADLMALRKLADRHGISLIEDCAHALGAGYGDNSIGTIGDYGIFSLQAIKHMTTVDGGILTIRDPSQIAIAKRIRWFGMNKGVPRTVVDIKELGFKYNMNNVTAAIGLAQLESVGPRIQRHIQNGRYFDSTLSRIPGVSVTNIHPKCRPSYWLYTLMGDSPESFERCLAEIGVAASKLHRPNHYHSIFGPFNRALPGLEAYYCRMTHIPCGWWVSDETRERIVERLSKG